MRLRTSAFAAAGEQVILGGTFFLTYGVLLRWVGADAVGVLSLVLVLAGIGAIANIGFGGALTRFLPMYEAREQRDNIVRSIESAVVCTVLLYGGLLLVTFYPFQLFIMGQAGPEYAALGKAMVLPATIYVFGVGVGSVTTGALTALNRNDLRFAANLVAAAGCLAVLFLGVPRFGAVAALWGLAVQAIVLLALSWIFVRSSVRELPLLPYRISRESTSELLGFGFQLQIQSLLVMTLEPVSRLLVAHFGTLAQVAYFSMAARLVMQVRAVLFSASQPVVPALAYLQERSPEAQGELYATICARLTLAAALVLSATAGAAPFVGELWIGSYAPDFILYATILSVGWLAVTIILGPYFLAYSTGYQRYNLIAHGAMAAANIVLGPALGALYGSTGVVVALSASLVVAGTIMGVGNARLRPTLRAFNMRVDLPALAFATAAAAAAIATFYAVRPSWPLFAAGVLSGAAWLAVVAPIVLFHPLGASARALFGKRA